MVASMMGFALEDALIKQAARGMPVGQIMVFIGLFGLAAFSLQSWRAGGPALPRSMMTPVMVVRSAFEMLGRVFYALAITLTPLTSASAILQATPLLAVLGAALMFGGSGGRATLDLDRRWFFGGHVDHPAQCQRFYAPVLAGGGGDDRLCGA